MATESDEEWDRVSNAGSDVISCSESDTDHESLIAIVPATRETSVPSSISPVGPGCDVNSTGASALLVATNGSSKAVEGFIDCALSESLVDEDVSTKNVSASDSFYSIDDKTVSRRQQDSPHFGRLVAYWSL